MTDCGAPAESTRDEWRDVLWPECAYIGGLECVAHAFSRHLGPEIVSRFAVFVGAAEPGARLTLQKGNDGFTLQITSEVIRDAQTGDVQLTRLASMSQAMNGVAAEARSSRSERERRSAAPAPGGRDGSW